MPLNIPGLLAPFQLLFYPRFVIPHLAVKDIRLIDFQALKKAGYRGAVFDKDNCLTIPYKDALVPELTEAWSECLDTFGEGNVVIVSNSAGTYLDAGGIQAESVAHHLRVPVLVHSSFKPAYSCIATIRSYFSALPDPIRDHELIIVGDRIFTDVIMANRIRNRWASSLNKNTDGPLAVWTTGVWKKESMVMRYLEKTLVDAVTQLSKHEPLDTSRFLRKQPEPEPEPEPVVVVKEEEPTPWYAQLMSEPTDKQQPKLESAEPWYAQLMSKPGSKGDAVEKKTPWYSRFMSRS